jgi:hypothetical protein
MPNAFARLLEAGDLRVGDVLYHPRRQGGGGDVEARVVDGGLEIDGRVFRSPSTAAGSIAGHATNGWTYWRVRANGKPLHSIRKPTAEG